jgi:hypothetical protein
MTLITLRTNPAQNYILATMCLLTIGILLYKFSLAKQIQISDFILGFLSIFFAYAEFRKLKEPLWLIGYGVVFVQNDFGKDIVKHSFDDYRSLLVENSKLYILKNGAKKKIVSKISCHPDDWKLMVEKLHEKQKQLEQGS